MAVLLRHWRKQHTCGWCFIIASISVAAFSAMVGALVAGLAGGSLIGLWCWFVYFCGFMIGVDESEPPHSGTWL